MNSSASLGMLAKALLGAQLEMKNPGFDSENPHFRSRFASLATVRETVIPVLLKHGLVLTQLPKASDGAAGCVNLLMHSSGEWILEECLLPLDKNNAQGAGSAITYARRYSMQSIAGVVADEDDDANAASASTTQGNGVHKPGDGAMSRVKPARRNVVTDTATQVKDALKEERDFDAFALVETITDADEKVYLWSFFDSKQRSRIKKQAEAA